MRKQKTFNSSARLRQKALKQQRLRRICNRRRGGRRAASACAAAPSNVGIIKSSPGRGGFVAQVLQHGGPSLGGVPLERQSRHAHCLRAARPVARSPQRRSVARLANQPLEDCQSAVDPFTRQIGRALMQGARLHCLEQKHP